MKPEESTRKKGGFTPGTSFITFGLVFIAFFLPPIFPDNFMATSLQTDLAILIIVALMLSHCAVPVSSLQILRLAPVEYFIGIAAGLLLTGVNFIIFFITESFFGESKIVTDEFLEQIRPGNTGQLIVLATELLIIATILEEVIFRGMIFTGFRKFGFMPAAVFSSLLYALIHVLPVMYIPMFIFGMVTCWLYSKSGNLAVPMLAHLVVNIAAFLELTGAISI